MITREIVNKDDQVLEKLAVDFLTNMKARPEVLGLSKKAMSEFGAAVEEYQTALARFMQGREILAALTMEKETKRAPVVNALLSLVKAAGYDVDEVETKPKNPQPCKQTIKREPEDHSSITPSVRLESVDGKVTVHVGDVPSWAHGVCIYRREVGETEWKMLHLAHESRYEDVLDGSEREYEYKARYLLRATTEAGASSETVRTTAGSELVAA